MEASSVTAPRGSRPSIGRLPLVRFQDRLLRWGLTGLAALILALLAFFFIRLYVEANPAFNRFGVFGLIPKLHGFEQFLSNKLSFLPFVGGPVPGPNYFIAGLILAIMILPIVTAITREVMATVPADHKEAALALGATRWEMIRTAILPYSRAGIAGASMLGLGRAIGETIAVTLVIGNAPTIGKQIFDQGYT